MSRIISIRGQVTESGQVTIPIATIDGMQGYVIRKFEVMSTDPNESIESAIKIYAVEQTTVDQIVDFSDQSLLGVCLIWQSTAQADVHESSVIFDNVTFNQDIFITNKAIAPSTATLNYHIEIEKRSLDISEQTVATLKDIRNVVARNTVV